MVYGIYNALINTLIGLMCNDKIEFKKKLEYVKLQYNVWSRPNENLFIFKYKKMDVEVHTCYKRTTRISYNNSNALCGNQRWSHFLGGIIER